MGQAKIADKAVQSVFLPLQRPVWIPLEIALDPLNDCPRFILPSVAEDIC